jgi:hypothetical protein
MHRTQLAKGISFGDSRCWQKKDDPRHHYAVPRKNLGTATWCDQAEQKMRVGRDWPTRILRWTSGGSPPLEALADYQRGIGLLVTKIDVAE